MKMFFSQYCWFQVTRHECIMPRNLLLEVLLLLLRNVRFLLKFCLFYGRRPDCSIRISDFSIRVSRFFTILILYCFCRNLRIAKNEKLTILYQKLLSQNLFTTHYSQRDAGIIDVQFQNNKFQALKHCFAIWHAILTQMCRILQQATCTRYLEKVQSPKVCNVTWNCT